MEFLFAGTIGFVLGIFFWGVILDLDEKYEKYVKLQKDVKYLLDKRVEYLMSDDNKGE